MKKKHFWFVIIGIILLIIMTFILNNLFSDQTKKFGISCAIFFVSTFPLVTYKDALKPSRGSFEINMTKKHYEKTGELGKYQRLCKILFLVTISLAAITLFVGLGEIFVLYLKA